MKKILIGCYIFIIMFCLCIESPDGGFTVFPIIGICLIIPIAYYDIKHDK